MQSSQERHRRVVIARAPSRRPIFGALAALLGFTAPVAVRPVVKVETVAERKARQRDYQLRYGPRYTDETRVTGFMEQRAPGKRARRRYRGREIQWRRERYAMYPF